MPAAISLFKSLLPPFGAGILLALCALPLSAGDDNMDQDTAANYVITQADDFVVDIYHNGRLVPNECRHLLTETFGATSERIDLPVRHGDWLVFHVVNDRLRWGGCSYFAAAGLFEKNEFGFVSNARSGDWSACDDPSHAAKFVSRKTYMTDCPAQKIANPWSDGLHLMRQHAGDDWAGDPIWGRTCDTWLKLIVP